MAQISKIRYLVLLVTVTIISETRREFPARHVQMSGSEEERELKEE